MIQMDWRHFGFRSVEMGRLLRYKSGGWIISYNSFDFVTSFFRVWKKLFASFFPSIQANAISYVIWKKLFRPWISPWISLWIRPWIDDRFSHFQPQIRLRMWIEDRLGQKFICYIVEIHLSFTFVFHIYEPQSLATESCTKPWRPGWNPNEIGTKQLAIKAMEIWTKSQRNWYQMISN